MDSDLRHFDGSGNPGSTPERKYQIFLSSTFVDLAEHRREATLGIVKARHIPIALEHYAPDTESKRQVIRAAIDDCQYYVLILGARYGSLCEGNNLGYVEFELNYALERQLQVLAFVMDASLVKEQRDGLKLSVQEDRAEIDNEDRYRELRRRLTQGSESIFHKPFKTANEVREELYHYFGKAYDTPGYIREPKDKAAREVVHIYAQSQFVRTVVRRLGSFEGVEPRLGVASEKKIAMGEAFRQLYEDNLRVTYDAVFFESGSTLSYVVERLTDILPHKGDIREGKQRPEILTNNALAYLYLWLCSDVMCHPVPDGPPDETYAGMFGPLTGRKREPDYGLPSLVDYDPKGYSLVKNLSAEIFRQTEDLRKPLILAASSGLQLSSSITAIRPKEKGKAVESYTGKRILDQLASNCRGFHVGSYENKLFKRCLYLTKAPMVVFVHDDKLDSPIEVGKCHFLFDNEASWQTHQSEYPLAIWVACSGETYERIANNVESSLSAGEWRVTVYGEAKEYPIVIAQNAAFRKAAAADGATICC